jgi:hypothetical protein
MKENMMTNNKPAFEISVVREGSNKESDFTKIGAAWPTKSGSGYNADLIALPVDRGIWRASPLGRRRCSCRSLKASERAFFGQVQADAEDPLELFRYRWYNCVSIRQDDCEKQMFDPAVSGISDGNEPMREGLLAKCNAFDGAIVRPLMKAQHPPPGAVYYSLTA